MSHNFFKQLRINNSVDFFVGIINIHHSDFFNVCNYLNPNFTLQSVSI